MNQPQTVQQYQRRLKQVPKINRELEEEIRNMQALVEEQENDINTQNVKIKLLQQQLGKLDKTLQTRQNQIQQLAQSEQKSAQKEKKYYMQIENYNKKIQSLKAETTKIQKNIAIIKKQSKVIESSAATANAERNKVLQQLTKGQLKLNGLTQTLNELKARAMEKGGARNEENMEGGKREEKQINELFMAIKKQMQLIDVLKKQKVHLVASTIFKYCEDDFGRLLEMKGE